MADLRNNQWRDPNTPYRIEPSFMVNPAPPATPGFAAGQKTYGDIVPFDLRDFLENTSESTIPGLMEAFRGENKEAAQRIRDIIAEAQEKKKPGLLDKITPIARLLAFAADASNPKRRAGVTEKYRAAKTRQQEEQAREQAGKRQVMLDKLATEDMLGKRRGALFQSEVASKSAMGKAERETLGLGIESARYNLAARGGSGGRDNIVDVEYKELRTKFRARLEKKYGGDIDAMLAAEPWWGPDMPNMFPGYGYEDPVTAGLGLDAQVDEQLNKEMDLLMKTERGKELSPEQLDELRAARRRKIMEDLQTRIMELMGIKMPDDQGGQKGGQTGSPDLGGIMDLIAGTTGQNVPLPTSFADRFRRGQNRPLNVRNNREDTLGVDWLEQFYEKK